MEADEVRFDVEFAAADRTLDFGYMTIGAGRIAGIKGVVSGMADVSPDSGAASPGRWGAR